MLQCERIDVSEGTDTNKTSQSKEFKLCNYWHFENIGYKFESNACNKCDDVLVTAYELKKHCNTECKRWLIDVDYRCIFWGIRRNEAVNVLNNSGLEDKVVLLMEFIQIKHPLKELKKEHLVEFILDTFTQVLMENGTELHGKSSMN